MSETRQQTGRRKGKGRASRTERPMSYGNSAYEKLWRVADRAYSEIAWAVQDIASGRIDRSQQKDYRSQRLAEMANELRKVLDEAQPEGVT